MSIPTRLPHAQHNETICDFLLTNPDAADWVITTAFYSSLHFVQEKIFPDNFDINGTTHRFDCFDAYYAAFRVAKRGVSKHQATILLVKKNIRTISADYRRLHDLCHDARYKNYQVNPATALLARRLLTKVKSACTPIPAAPSAATGGSAVGAALAASSGSAITGSTAHTTP